MHMVNVRFQSQQLKAMLIAAFGDERLAGCLYFASKNLASILWYPHEMVGYLVMCPTGFPRLQGIVH